MNKNVLEPYAAMYFTDELETTRQTAEQLRLQDADMADQYESSFYQRMQQAHEQDTRAFDVQSLAEDHGVALVSAVRAYGNLGPFRPLQTQAFKGIRIFDILLRPNQIICASSIKEGDSSANLYGNWGVVVGNGTVQSAYPYDATTSVKQGQVFSQFAPRFTGVRPSEQMLHALQARRLYNEINVKMESIAGIYYCQDEPDAPTRDFPSQEFEDVIDPLSIPRYLMRHGQFYPIASVDDISNQDNAKPMPPKEVIQNSIVPTTEQSEYMIAYLKDMLTLAPRNAITSGTTRGSFAYDHKDVLNLQPEKFISQHELLVAQDTNLSLRLYGAMALHAYAEAAKDAGDFEIAQRSADVAREHCEDTVYKEYKQRILPTGNLSITEEDLRYYIEHESLPPYLGDH